MTRKDILKGSGKIFHEQALKKAHKEYDKYMKEHLTTAEKDYLMYLIKKSKNLIINIKNRIEINQFYF